MTDANRHFFPVVAAYNTSWGSAGWQVYLVLPSHSAGILTYRGVPQGLALTVTPVPVFQVAVLLCNYNISQLQKIWPCCLVSKNILDMISHSQGRFQYSSRSNRQDCYDLECFV